MAEQAFLGLRGNGDWVTDQRPKNFREGILYEWPNGDAPLTAMLSKLSSKGTDDPEFNWWTKKLPEQQGAITGLYTNAALTTAVVGAEVSGSVLYIKMAEADTKHFRAGHIVILRYTSDATAAVRAKVLDRVLNGASSYIVVRTLEADDNSSSFNLTNVDNCMIIGNVNPEGGERPEALAYDPTKYYNYTQIVRNSLEMTRTAKKTRLRTGDQYKEAKREALMLHSIEMEKMFIWGEKSEGTGDNGKPERTTQGMIPFIIENAAANVTNFQTVSTLNDIDFTGKTWLDEDGGELWLNAWLEQIFRYGRDEKMAFVGSGTLMNINRLVKAGAEINIVPGAAKYGIRVYTWIHSTGILHMKRAPLFSYNAADRNSMLVFEPQELMERPLDNTFFKSDQNKERNSSSDSGIDGTQEEYITETGMEVHFPDRHGYALGFGATNGG